MDIACIMVGSNLVPLSATVCHLHTQCMRQLPGSWSTFPHWQSWEHPQGHYSWVVMEICMATGDSGSLTDV